MHRATQTINRYRFFKQQMITRLARPRKLASRVVRDAVIGSGLARALTLPVGAAAMLLSTRLAVDAVGATSYGLVALIVTLPYLIPISDFGLGAALTSHLGPSGWDVNRSPAIVRRIVRMLGGVALACIVIAALIASQGWFNAIIGIGLPNGNLLCFLVVVTFAVTIPLGVGTRILLGLQRQALATVLQALTPTYGLALLAGALALHRSQIYVVILCLSAAPLLCGVSQCLVAAKIVGALSDSRDQWHLPSKPPVKPDWSFKAIIVLSVPMTIMAIALPIAFQSDKIILAHFSTSRALSEYSIVANAYGSLAGIVGAAGIALWPHFLKIQASGGKLSRPLLQYATALVGAALLLSISLLIFGGDVIRIMSDGEISAPPSLYYWFGALLLCTAFQYPSAMLLLAMGDAWFCARCSLVMMLLNVPLSILFASSFGAAGPIAGSCVAMTAAATIPFWYRCRVKLSLPEPDVGASPRSRLNVTEYPATLDAPLD